MNTSGDIMNTSGDVQYTGISRRCTEHGMMWWFPLNLTIFLIIVVVI